jgi:subtilase family serine protease
VVIGALPMTQPIHIEVALKMRDRTGLDAFIANNAKNQVNGAAPQLMTSAQFLATHAPTQLQAQTVVDYLLRFGFTNVVIAPNRLLVSADGNAATARDAFMTTFAQVRTQDGRIAFANTDDVRIPAALQDNILAVVGLQTVYQAHTFVHRFDAGSTHTNAITGHNPLEFASIYSGTGVKTAAGVTVGIVTEGNLTQAKADLNTFTANNGLATVVTQLINTGGVSNDTSGTNEWDLDSQDVLGMGGGQIGKIVFYNMPNLVDTSLTANFNAAVVANTAKIISVSLGVCETSAKGDGSAAADDQIFAIAVAQGQTFSVATGDSGADECPSDGLSTPIPSWPAASQYVIAVTGTVLNASTTTWGGETVWSGTGGSPSAFEPKPSWQDALVSGTHRGVADVAFDGSPDSGAVIVFNGTPGQFGGTSLSAPLFSGLWARVIAVKGTSVGFAGPLIYALPAGDLHDITSGSNGAETAGVGYDFASGRGSILLSSAINNIGPPTNSPPVANFSFTSVALTVNFTDSSTDPDGNSTITSHAWTFGDGSTSTATNPSHTYATAGTYTVSETVTDNGGLTNKKTSSVVVATSRQIVVDPGFETGTASPWSAPAGVINNKPAEPSHTGTWDAWLDGKGTAHADTILQQLAIPAGWKSATLRFYLHIDTAETTTTLMNDRLTVRVTDASNNVLAVLATYSNLDHASGYATHTFDLTPYIGKTIRIKFTGNENSSLQTSFVLDDISVVLR